MRFVSCPTCGRQFADAVQEPHTNWRGELCPAPEYPDLSMSSVPDCPECAACDALYDSIEDLAGGLGRSAHERDAAAHLRDAQASLSRAGDALRRGVSA